MTSDAEKLLDFLIGYKQINQYNIDKIIDVLIKYPYQSYIVLINVRLSVDYRLKLLNNIIDGHNEQIINYLASSKKYINKACPNEKNLLLNCCHENNINFILDRYRNFNVNKLDGIDENRKNLIISYMVHKKLNNAHKKDN